MAIAKITTLTPVHIGSGSTFKQNIDFVQEGGRIGIIDANKVAALIGSDKTAIDQWVNAILNQTPLMIFLRNNRGKKDITIDTIAERVFSVVGNSKNNVSDLKEQIRTAFEGAYLPGSSLKGAIRTAIFNRLIVSAPTHAQNLNNSKIRKKDGKEHYKGVSLEKKYFGNDANHDLLRLLRIGDAHFGDTIGLLANTLNQKGSEHEIKNSVKQFIECIPAQAESIFQISIPDALLRQIKLPEHKETKEKIPNFSKVETWKQVFELINAHTKHQIEKEIKLYKNAHLPKEAAQFVPFLEELNVKFAQLSDKECILRVGFGTGYLSMTGGWALEQWKSNKNELNELSFAVRRRGGYENMPLPKSRKIGQEGIPLGFVKITLLNDDEVKQWKNNLSVRQAEKAQAAEQARLNAEQEAEAARLAAEEAKKPQLYEGSISKGLEVDAEVVVSAKPNRVKIYVKGYEDKQYEMVDSAPQPKGYICRVALVVEKGKILRVRHLKPK